MTYSSLSKYLQFARRIIIKLLKNDLFVKMSLPDTNKLQEYQEIISHMHPDLQDVWGTMDGLKIRIEQAPDGVVQGPFYDGWKCDHYVTTVLCVAHNGTIPACFYNVPGCKHDSTVADWGIYILSCKRFTRRRVSNLLLILHSAVVDFHSL
jgi:hypothetical protein